MTASLLATKSAIGPLHDICSKSSLWHLRITGPIVRPRAAKIRIGARPKSSRRRRDRLPGAAAFMIRDGDIPGCDITILEELDVIGGSLDGSGTPEQGYVLRGGRMLESKYLCTFELFSSIPTLDGAARSLKKSLSGTSNEDLVQVAPRPRRPPADGAQIRAQ